jgi:hypothetical protein
MENEKFSPEKPIAITSIVMIVLTVIGILTITSAIIFTEVSIEGNFVMFLAKLVASDLPEVTNFLIVLISTVAFGIFLVVFILKSMKKESMKIENEKSTREKSIAALSAGLLAFAVIGILIAATAIILTKVDYPSVIFTEFIPGKLPAITKLLVISISAVAYEIFFVLLIFILILKELCLSGKMITLVVNLVAGIAAILYVPVFIFAVRFPIIRQVI